MFNWLLIPNGLLSESNFCNLFRVHKPSFFLWATTFTSPAALIQAARMPSSRGRDPLPASFTDFCEEAPEQTPLWWNRQIHGAPASSQISKPDMSHKFPLRATSVPVPSYFTAHCPFIFWRPLNSNSSLLCVCVNSFQTLFKWERWRTASSCGLKPSDNELPRQTGTDSLDVIVWEIVIWRKYGWRPRAHDGAHAHACVCVCVGSGHAHRAEWQTDGWRGRPDDGVHYMHQCAHRAPTQPSLSHTNTQSVDPANRITFLWSRLSHKPTWAMGEKPPGNKDKHLQTCTICAKL